jgi:hypothetical protein
MLDKAKAAASKAKAAATDLAKAADDKLHINEKVSSHREAAKAKVMAVPPEQRQKYLDGASFVLSTAAIMAGPKTAVAASLVGGAASMHKSNAPQTSRVQVAATAPGGQVMTIALENGEVFQVDVPDGLKKGDMFEVDVPVPAGAAAPSAAGGGGMMAAASAAAAGAATATLTSAAVGQAAKQVGLTPAQGKAGMQVAGALGVTPATMMQAGKDAKKAGLL